MSVIIVTVLFSVSNRFDKLRIFALRFRARSVTYVYVRALAGARRALNYSFLKTIRGGVLINFVFLRCGSAPARLRTSMYAPLQVLAAP